MDAVSSSVEGATAPEWVRHQKLIAWVAQMVALAKSDRIPWCDGSKKEYDRLCATMVSSGTLKKFNSRKRHNSYLAWSHPSNSARLEDRTSSALRDSRIRSRPMGSPSKDAQHTPGAV